MPKAPNNVKLDRSISSMRSNNTASTGSFATVKQEAPQYYPSEMRPSLAQEVPAGIRVAQVVGITTAAFLAGLSKN